ncbi:MAG: serine/threonine-protein kinase [Myxococcaceae bacterium]
MDPLAHGDTVLSSGKSGETVPGLVGKTLGSYELTALLGAGGMGEVYRGRHTLLGREVAVKVLRDEYASNPEVVQRFFQEAKLVNDINHPHIVQIIDFAQVDGSVFCVMELLQGRSLATVIEQEGPLSLARIIDLTDQVCDALSAAHRLGVVHRDIKPDNLFVTLDAQGAERVKVLDFGIARRPDGSKTAVGMVMGTPGYMAPEQAAGRAVDARADLYSLGVVLYELLTASSMVELKGPPTRVTVSAKGEPIAAPLSDAIEACLSLDAARRPVSVDALRAALHDRTSRRRPVVIALAAAAVLAVVGALALLPPSPPGERAGVRGVTSPEPTAVTTQIDAGPAPIAAVQPVEPPTIDAGPAGEPHLPIKNTTGPSLALKKRLKKVQSRYDALVKKFGTTQLTSIERQTVAAALAKDAAPTDLPQLAADAESALGQAERRLDH